MKQKIILAVGGCVVLAAAFALHRPQANTSQLGPTRQAETNDAVPAEPRRSPPRQLNRSPATAVPQQTTPAARYPQLEKNTGAERRRSALPVPRPQNMRIANPADNTEEPTPETPPPSETPTPPVDGENIELPFVPAES